VVASRRRKPQPIKTASNARSLAPLLTAGATVVLESTTYPGTTEELLVPLLEAGSGMVAGRDFHVGYSPERIDPGNKTWGFVETPKVVSGITPDSLAKVRGFYDSLVNQTVPVSSPKEAELTKLLENTFRHVNIALVNELAVFGHQLGVNVWESIEAASTKPFGFMKFTPGPGVGGHCLPVDPSYLSWEVRRKLGKSFRFVELANDINDHMPDYVVQRMMEMLNRDRKSLNGAKILSSTGREVFTYYVPGPKGPVFMSLIEKTFGRSSSSSDALLPSFFAASKSCRACSRSLILA